MTTENGQLFDLFIVGGGINGVGIARDAAGRGLSVGLCEMGDLGAATSSASSKLIHGGLRYLEHGALRLVREALTEREVLLHIAPHLVRPLRFVLPLASGQRPRWTIKAGLLLYDHLGRRSQLPGSGPVKLAGKPDGVALKPEVRRGFSYYDCWADDARLVIHNALDAARLGARILVRTKLERARLTEGVWEIYLQAIDARQRSRVRARALVNAAGPWVNRVLESIEGGGPGQAIRLVKGSHIVVPRIHEASHAYLLQNDDGRVIFVIPFEHRFSLVGTTEVDAPHGPDSIEPAAEEIAYLCRALGIYLDRPVKPDQVVWSYSGLRPLAGNGHPRLSAISRDYRLDLAVVSGVAPLLTIYGGKLTTYRRLAERVLARLAPFFPRMTRSWTDKAPLPGADPGPAGVEASMGKMVRNYPRLPEALVRSLYTRHGTLCREVLGEARTLEEMGEHFGAGLYAREVDYMVRREWARTAEDVLWRRSKFGLHLHREQRSRLAEFLACNQTQPETSRFRRR